MNHPFAHKAHAGIRELWADPWRFQTERQLWAHVMAFQHKCGVFDHVPGFASILASYRSIAERPLSPFAIRQIEDRERITRHDVKARIEIFNEKATEYWGDNRSVPTSPRPDRKLEFAHWGMTSADVVDNISLIQMSWSLARLQHILQVVSSQSMDAWYAEAIGPLYRAEGMLPFRGFKGPVGTSQDMAELLGGGNSKHGYEMCKMLEEHVAEEFDIHGGVLTNTGQVYPRSVDTMYGSAIMGAMAVMPSARHWRVIAGGYFRMITEYSGDQWNEGDVSTSVIRRIALPGITLSLSAAIGEATA